MQRHEPQSLGDLLRKEIEESRSAPLLDEFKAVKAWPVVMGADIAAKTGRPFIQNGMMTIKVASSTLRHELTMLRTQLRNALNAEVGKAVVKEIRFIS